MIDEIVEEVRRKRKKKGVEEIYESRKENISELRKTQFSFPFLIALLINTSEMYIRAM